MKRTVRARTADGARIGAELRAGTPGASRKPRRFGRPSPGDGFRSGFRTGTVVARAQDIMHTDVLTVSPSTSVLDCARRMVAARKGYAVLLRDGAMVGIVTEWDFLEKVTAAGAPPADTPVERIASAPVTSCDADTPTSEVVERMARDGIRRMVVTRDGKVVGVISSRNVLDSFRRYVDQLSADISGFHPTLP